MHTEFFSIHFCYCYGFGRSSIENLTFFSLPESDAYTILLEKQEGIYG